MGIARGPNIVKDDLVFGYDTGYGIADNSTATRFYPGRPTDNLFATTAMELDDDAGTYTNDIESGTDSIGKYFIKDTSAAPWWSGLRIYNNSVRPLTAGVSYVLSFECRSPQSGWSWAGDANASGGGWSGNDTGRLSNTNTVFDSTGGTVYTSAMVNTWQRVTYRVTMKDSSVFTGSSAYPHDSFFTTTNNVKIYYRNSQFELGKTIATPFVNGARSSTTSLIDLKRTTNIDVSNVSFDSTGQPTFDGTDDYIQLGNTLNSLGSVATFDMVFKSSETNDNYRVMIGWGHGNNNYSSIALGNLAGAYSDESAHVILNSSDIQMYVTGIGNSANWKDNTFHHMAVTVGANNYSIWIDGVERSFTFASGSQATSLSQVVGYNSNITAQIGQRPYGGGTGSFKGEIPVMKIHNRILTDDEIKQNYNAYKNRFDI